jgi:hypothetical protein
MKSKATIRRRLKTGVWTVIFKKVSDDSIREMKCSLMEEYIGKPKRRKNTKSNQKTLAVWDVDKNGWRSFRLENVITMVKEKKKK